MKQAVFWVRFFHSIVLFFLLVCLGLTLYAGLTGRITNVTWIAFGLVLAEGIVLLINRWHCPLTTFAEKLGAPNGAVAHLFMPAWLADRLFLICGVLFGVSTLLLLLRVVL